MVVFERQVQLLKTTEVKRPKSLDYAATVPEKENLNLVNKVKRQSSIRGEKRVGGGGFKKVSKKSKINCAKI